MPLPTQVHPNGDTALRLDGQPPQPPQEPPKSPPQEPPKSHRPMALFGAIGALSLAVLALAAILILSGSHSSSQNTATPAAVYQQKLNTALAPLMTANQTLSTALGGIDGSQHSITAAQNAVTEDEAAVAAVRGAVAILPVPSADATLQQQTQQALTQETGYLQGVSGTLADPTSQSSSSVRSLATNTQAAFVPIASVAPAASTSITGTDNLLNWATSAAKLSQQPKQIVKNTTTTVITPGGGTPNPGGGLSYCDQNIQVNSVTSCPFAQNVFVAYWATANQGSATVTAYSPATGNTYDIDCSTNGVTVDCSGGTTNGAFITFPMSAVQVYNNGG
jgi:hypothetical protein